MFLDLEECHPLLLKLFSPWKVEVPFGYHRCYVVTEDFKEKKRKVAEPQLTPPTSTPKETPMF